MLNVKPGKKIYFVMGMILFFCLVVVCELHIIVRKFLSNILVAVMLCISHELLINI